MAWAPAVSVVCLEAAFMGLGYGLLVVAALVLSFSALIILTPFGEGNCGNLLGLLLPGALLGVGAVVFLFSENSPYKD
jgi:hypothetical protein